MLTPDTLGQIPLFHGLTKEQLLRLLPFLHHKTFPAEKTIIAAEERGEAAYIILSGTVKVHVGSMKGRDVILAILGAGQIVGEMSLADSLGYSATVVTLEASTFLAIDRTTFQECLQTMPEMTYNLVRILSSRLRLANAQIQSLAALDVFGRVARQLMAFAHEYGDILANACTLIRLHLTQNDLADLVGASRVRVNQVLASYRQSGYISIENHRIIIRDSAALIARCQYLDAPVCVRHR
jgi:CRP/FNR family cyclic AMP-dependent transcriptional regulator